MDLIMANLEFEPFGNASVVSGRGLFGLGWGRRVLHCMAFFQIRFSGIREVEPSAVASSYCIFRETLGIQMAAPPYLPSLAVESYI